jgi:NAD(P)-dependent dehydrogenase (short-subunit alcohol dehydrogenase family)
MGKLRRAVVERDLVEGRRVVVTGANSGLGRATSELLLGLGARVVMTARRADAGEAEAAVLRHRYPSASVECVRLDLSDRVSVAAAAQQIIAGPVDVLVNNAGGMADGTLEAMFVGNVLGHFQLTRTLLPALLEARGKLVVVSSLGHAGAVLPRPGESLAALLASGRGSSIGKYGLTKLFGIWHAMGLHRRHHAEGLRTYALHPGGIATEGFDKTQGLPFYERWGATLYKHLFAEKDVSLGAQAALHCIGNRDADRESGRYYDNCAPASPRHCDDPARMDELFALCDERLSWAARNLRLQHPVAGDVRRFPDRTSGGAP